MKNLTITLITLLVISVEVDVVAEPVKYQLRHRDLAQGVMCCDLGKRRGKHTIRITDGNKKYLRKLAKYGNAKRDKCPGPAGKSLADMNLDHLHAFCKDFNKDHVTIYAPEGLRKCYILLRIRTMMKQLTSELGVPNSYEVGSIAFDKVDDESWFNHPSSKL